MLDAVARALPLLAPPFRPRATETESWSSPCSSLSPYTFEHHFKSALVDVGGSLWVAEGSVPVGSLGAGTSMTHYPPARSNRLSPYPHAPLTPRRPATHLDR